MAGPIGNQSGIRPVAPRLSLPSAPPEPPPKGVEPPLGRDQNQVTAVPTAQALPDLRDSVGQVSADDFLAMDLGTAERSTADVRLDFDLYRHDSDPFNVNKFTRIERDAVPINDLHSDWDEVAKDYLEANEGLAQAAYEKLTSKQQDQFKGLDSMLSGDKSAQLALQVMLIEGKLTGGARSTSGGTLLDSLHDVATKPTLEGLDAKKLVSDLVQEVALPASIAQESYGTCTVTSVQIKLARENPAEYARLVGALASPEGKANLANGDTVVRDPGSEEAQYDKAKRMMPDGKIVEVDVLDERTDSSRLFQAALMEYGLGDDVDYDPIKDEASDNTKMGASLVHRAMQGLSGSKVETLLADRYNGYADDGAKVMTPEAIVSRLADETRKGNSVPIGLAWGEADASGKFHGFHSVDVSKVDGDRVYFNNPWGKEESMTRAEFTQRVHFADVGSFQK